MQSTQINLKLISFALRPPFFPCTLSFSILEHMCTHMQIDYGRSPRRRRSKSFMWRTVVLYVLAVVFWLLFGFLTGFHLLCFFFIEKFRCSWKWLVTYDDILWDLFWFGECTRLGSHKLMHHSSKDLEVDTKIQSNNNASNN